MFAGIILIIVIQMTKQHTLTIPTEDILPVQKQNFNVTQKIAEQIFANSINVTQINHNTIVNSFVHIGLPVLVCLLLFVAVASSIAICQYRANIELKK